MNPEIDQGIAPIILAPQLLLTSETKEIVADAASDGAWVNKTPRQVSKSGVNRRSQASVVMMLSLLNLPPHF